MFTAKNYRELLRLFAAFVLPAVGSQLLSGIYTIVDGYFVGWGMGEQGLAAIGLAFPFTVVITAAGAGIGVGGGALLAMSSGRKRKPLTERLLGSMVFMAAMASLFCVIVLTPSAAWLLSRYEVGPVVGAMAQRYSLILFIFAPAQVFTMAMLGAVRNDGFPKRAMYIMILSFCVNIVLDWLWVIVFPFGIDGAAWATGISQLVSAALLSGHFIYGGSRVKLRRALIKPCRALSAKVTLMGFSPFGVQIATAVSMILYNWQALAYGGDMGVAAYAVIGYIVPVGVMLEEGIAEGMQPLISYFHGARLAASRRLTERIGFTCSVAAGLFCTLLVFISAGLIPEFFSMTGKAAEVATEGLLLSAPVFAFLGIAKSGASCYQATGHSLRASILTYADPFILQPLYLWTLPLFFGLDGVWLSLCAANVTLAALFCIMWRSTRAKHRVRGGIKLAPTRQGQTEAE